MLNRSKRKLMKNNQKMFSQYEKIQQGIQSVPPKLTALNAIATESRPIKKSQGKRTTQPNQSPNNRGSAKGGTSPSNKQSIQKTPAESTSNLRDHLSTQNFDLSSSLKKNGKQEHKKESVEQRVEANDEFEMQLKSKEKFRNLTKLLIQLNLLKRIGK